LKKIEFKIAKDTKQEDKPKVKKVKKAKSKRKKVLVKRRRKDTTFNGRSLIQAQRKKCKRSKKKAQ
jgi:hypothetical protein